MHIKGKMEVKEMHAVSDISVAEENRMYQSCTAVLVLFERGYVHAGTFKCVCVCVCVCSCLTGPVSSGAI